MPVYLLSHFPGTECKKLIWHCAWAMKASIPKLFFLISLPQVSLRTIVSCWFKSDLFFIFYFYFSFFSFFLLLVFSIFAVVVWLWLVSSHFFVILSITVSNLLLITFIFFLYWSLNLLVVLTFISNENIQLTRSANFIWCLCCLNIFFNEPTTLNTFTLAGQCYLHSKPAKHAICFQCHHCLGHQWH